MWVNITKFQVADGKLPEIVDCIYENETLMAKLRQFEGFKFSYTLESSKKPNHAISMTVWDNAETAAEYFNHPVYQEVLNQIADLIVSEPKFSGFDVVNVFSFEPELEGLMGDI